MKGVLASLVLAACVVLAWPQVGLADTCSFCSEEIDPETNPLKCPSCIEIAKRITNGNEKVWVLDFQPGELELIQIKDDTGDTETYWFLPYTITNRDDVPHDYFIDIDAVSDRSRHRHDRDQGLHSYYTDRETGRPEAGPGDEHPKTGKLRGTYSYHDSWIPDVYEKARKILGLREGELLLSQRDVSMPPPGKQNVPPSGREEPDDAVASIALPTIQPGETLRCVALFKSWDPQMDVLSVFVRGLTNSSIIQHDDYVRPADRPGERDLKEAVLVLTYNRPGDEFAHGTDPLEYVTRRWTDQPRTIRSDLRSKPSDTVTDD